MAFDLGDAVCFIFSVALPQKYRRCKIEIIKTKT